MTSSWAPGVPSPVPWWQTGWVVLPVLTAAAGAGVGLAVLRESLRKPPPPPICPPTVGPEGGRISDVDYLERRTQDALPDEPLPMVVVLHGRNSSATEISKAAQALPRKVRIIAPEGFVTQNGSRGWLDRSRSLVEEIQDATAELETFIEDVQRCRPTLGKPIVAGYDEGATVAYDLAVDLPDAVSAVVGAAGELPVELGVVQVPTRFIHGRQDELVPFDPLATAVAAMAGAGAPAELVPMTGVGHSFAGALQLEWLQNILDLLPRPPLPPPVPKPPEPPPSVVPPPGEDA